MENYSKGSNVEEELRRDKIPIPNLPEHFLWMQVSGGSKMRNVLECALNHFQEKDVIVWSASGPALQKAISCVEIIKRKFPLHQITRLCYKKVDEHWEPKLEGLEPLVVTREIPTIHIVLSKTPLDPNELGYQGPMKKSETMKSTKRNRVKPPKSAHRAEMLKQFTGRSEESNRK